MRVVTQQSLGSLQLFNYGAFSKVYRVNLGEKKYCYKKFQILFPNDIMGNIAKMTDEDYLEEYLTPLFLVEKIGHRNFEGYLTAYYENLIELDDVLDRKRKILLLKKAKLAIMKLHQIYGLIHGDINAGNMLFDEEMEKAYLLDFDSALKIGQNIGSDISFSSFVKKYLKYYPLDFRVDAYIFNITTLSLLSGIKQHRILECINNNTLTFPEENRSILKLSKELILKNPRKEYSGEYIIDYID